MKKQKLLINYVYWTPIGHVLEALKYACGFMVANKNLEIYLLLNSQSPYELAKGCSCVKKVYPVNTKESVKNGKRAKSYKKIPKEWDFIVTNNMLEVEVRDPKDTGPDERGMLEHLKISKEIFKASKGKGTIYSKEVIPKGLKYKSAKLNLSIPKKSKEFVKKYKYGGPKFCMLLGGSAGARYYPSMGSWEKIIKRINKEFPSCKIYLTGLRKGKKGGTITQGFEDKEISILFRKFDNIVDCYDIGLWNQLALLELIDILIAPHSGFAFLASCVNTPWLAISGGDWNEYFFNNYPFYCVLPNDKDFPYLGKGKYTKHAGTFELSKGKIPPFKPENLEKKIPEMIEGIKLLLDKNFTYKKALRQYVKNIKKSVCKKDRLLGSAEWEF